MAWIRSHTLENAAGAAKSAFDALLARSSSGRLSNVWQAYALDPKGLSATFELYRALKDDPAPLTAAQYELLALVVSATNGCGYCVAHHGPRLATALGDESLARAVARDYREADLPARDRVLLDWAVALTCEPSERKQEDVERVREYGFDDAAILRATEIAAFYNSINRVVCALGVELESHLEPWEFGAQK